MCRFRETVPAILFVKHPAEAQGKISLPTISPTVIRYDRYLVRVQNCRIEGMRFQYSTQVAKHCCQICQGRKAHLWQAKKKKNDDAVLSLGLTWLAIEETVVHPLKNWSSSRCTHQLIVRCRFAFIRLSRGNAARWGTRCKKCEEKFRLHSGWARGSSAG